MGGRGGCPFASTTTTDAHPKVSNRDSGFWGSFPLPPPASLPPFDVPPSCLDPSPSSPRSPPCPPSSRTASGGATLHPCTFSHPRGVALETQFRNLHICRPDAFARASGPYILTIFSERCERGGGLFARVGIRFLERTSGRSRPARNPSTGKPTLDGATPVTPRSRSRSVLSLPHPLIRFSLFRESAESYFTSRASYAVLVP